MAFRADLSRDIPNAGLPKRCIFYAQGLKVYGLLPYLLNRRLKGEFISNYYVHSSGAFRGVGMIAPTAENNYTVIPYTQKEGNAQLLLGWLYEDRGFEWAIAAPEYWDENLLEWNAYKSSPQTWVPSSSEAGWKEGFEKAIAGDRVAMALLGGGDHVGK